MRFCEWLKKEKEDRGLTYDEIVKMTGLSQHSIVRSCLGHSLPHDSTMELYFEAFSIPVEDWAKCILYFREQEYIHRGYQIRRRKRKCQTK